MTMPSYGLVLKQMDVTVRTLVGGVEKRLITGEVKYVTECRAGRRASYCS